jgi:2-polyprenyl-3-methyl-5-hydroxy-6-metoxy-1,4-benzoquinol methylase
MKKRKAIETQNQIQYDDYDHKGGVVLGPYTSHVWRDDPKHLTWMLARYKFCSKMLIGKKNIIEVGCGDSFGTAILLQTVEKVHAIDMEPLVIEENIKIIEYGNRCSYEVLDITAQHLEKKFDGAVSLDVIEHIPKDQERNFMMNIHKSLTADAVFIIGTPNVTAQQYASPGSAAGHINLKSGEELRDLMSSLYQNVFSFSMNDEVVHTGFTPMAHYLFCMGVGKKNGDLYR